METGVYGAYGYRVARTVDVPRGAYAGYVREADLSWYVLGLRIYIPWLRRFTCTDVLSPFGEGGLNRYTYCVGDPINEIDPSGQASWKWLGDLLGRIGGAIGKGIDTVSQVTPTTALTTIGAMADVVAVGTTIGAVAAGALGDESAAGILGWVAAGSGLAGVALGVAGQAIGKMATRRAPSRSMSRTVETFDDGRVIKTFAGPDVASLPEIKGRIRGRFNKRIQPEWQRHSSRSGAMNYMADTEVKDKDIFAFVERLDKTLPKDQPIDILLGVHGDMYGKNWVWSQTSNASLRKYGDEDWTFTDFANMLLKKPIDRNIRLHDVADITSSEFKAVVRQRSHVVHGYCFGAVDPKVMRWLNIAGPQMSYSLVLDT